jgi:hypothetical protein
MPRDARVADWCDWVLGWGCRLVAVSGEHVGRVGRFLWMLTGLVFDNRGVRVRRVRLALGSFG